MTVGALARQAGLQPSAVRYYEARRLIHSRRLSNGYRVYDGSAVATFRFVRSAKQLGFTLQEIGQVLQVRREGRLPCGCVRAIAARNLNAIEGKLRELTGLREELLALLARPLEPASDSQVCSLIEAGPRGDAP